MKGGKEGKGGGRERGRKENESEGNEEREGVVGKEVKWVLEIEDGRKARRVREGRK